MSNSVFPEYRSNKRYLIGINGRIEISNDRDCSDFFTSFSSDWSGMHQGNDGYPTIDLFYHYYIGGGQDPNFKATAIEFYGVITKT